MSVWKGGSWSGLGRHQTMMQSDPEWRRESSWPRLLCRLWKVQQSHWVVLEPKEVGWNRSPLSLRNWSITESPHETASSSSLKRVFSWGQVWVFLGGTCHADPILVQAKAEGALLGLKRRLVLCSCVSCDCGLRSSELALSSSDLWPIFNLYVTLSFLNCEGR